LIGCFTGEEQVSAASAGLYEVCDSLGMVYGSGPGQAHC